MFLEICMQINSVVFALNPQINKQKYAKTINLVCAGNKVFVKYQAQGGGLTSTPLRTPLPTYCSIFYHNQFKHVYDDNFLRLVVLCQARV